MTKNMAMHPPRQKPSIYIVIFLERPRRVGSEQETERILPSSNGLSFIVGVLQEKDGKKACVVPKYEG